MFLWPVIALAAILTAVWFLGVRRPVPIGGTDEVLSVLRDAHPEFVPADVVLDRMGGNALATDAAGREIIFLFMIGNQVATRVLEPGGVRSVETIDGPDGSRRMDLRLHDLGCPRLGLTLASTEAARWVGRLERLVASPDGAAARSARVPLSR